MRNQPSPTHPPIHPPTEIIKEFVLNDSSRLVALLHGACGAATMGCTVGTVTGMTLLIESIEQP